MNLMGRLAMIGGAGLILIGVGGGLGALPFVVLGGIAFGFALGFGACARAAERVLAGRRCTCGDGSAEEDRGAVLRCPVHGRG